MRIKVGLWLLAALLNGCDNTPAPEKGFAGLGHQAAAFTPAVSYTHLTLPTIYSV